MLPIEKCDLFSGLDACQQKAALDCLKVAEKEYNTGETLFLEGDNAPIGIVLSGEIEIKKCDYHGNSNIISRLFAGDVMGAAACFSFIHQLPFDVVCAFSSRVLFLDPKKLACPCTKACPFHTKIIENLLSLLADKNILLSEKVDILTKRTTKEKLLTFLFNKSKKAKSKRFSINMTRRQLADFLSVDRSAMIRELSSMRANNIIDYKDNIFWFL